MEDLFLHRRKGNKVSKPIPIPSNVNLPTPSNLQKERPVTHSKVTEIFTQLRCRMLLGVVLLTTGSTTGVPMSPGYGGCQTATPPPYYTTTTYATTGSYTPLHDNQSSEHLRHGNNCSALSVTNFLRHRIVGSQPWLLHRIPKYNSAPSYITREPYYYTEVPKYYITEAPEYFTYMYATPDYYTNAYKTKALKYYTTTYATKTADNSLPRSIHNAIPTCYAEAAFSCYVELKHYTDAPVYYTTTYATPSYNTAAPKYYTEEAAYYTTTNFGLVYNGHAGLVSIDLAIPIQLITVVLEGLDVKCQLSG
ncbi:hypothetical protein DAPPUDRAFT_236791 [Daphnia pulex]|uniref:Uncharacterized protein n=1 Tax=Daphnia pulex TaxID=6669 RepID=E9G335_DAPPU|nr:hypothetical protein DAPPUDRAFT_236791 [Daphnia pulex]|eukprot:EFX86399.1 hypothetical protein DAPPUDRAFT_236791 [Daphnia pulex]